MIIRTQTDGFIHPLGSEITPQAAYLDRRRWLAHSALTLGSAWDSLRAVTPKPRWALLSKGRARRCREPLPWKP